MQLSIILPILTQENVSQRNMPNAKSMRSLIRANIQSAVCPRESSRQRGHVRWLRLGYASRKELPHLCEGGIHGTAYT
ncbi:hypothetical protein PQR67_16885 [Paraburkholderia fungorum]|uniref:hypothetical protein n=1 Tax=Paraburkholderia fungorum TaxID=134537 RepID=UPI0038BAC66A